MRKIFAFLVSMLLIASCTNTFDDSSENNGSNTPDTECANNEIRYVTSDGIPLIPNSLGIATFGANLVSNKIENGIGILVFDKDVTNIGNDAFADCSDLKSMTMPSCVVNIGISAFSGCSGLTNITIPAGVASIGKYAFFGCPDLKEVHITDLDAWCNIDFENEYANPLYYADNLYLNDELITEYVSPDDVSEIKNYAFCNYSGLTSVTIPNSVTNIGNSAFFGCNALERLELNCKTIDGWFSQNSSIKKIVFGNSVTCINDYAFRDCSGLTSVTIPNSVTSIGEDAFYGCSSLDEVHITALDVWCNIDFENKYANPVYSAKNLYLNNQLITELVVPDGVSEIKNYTFCNNSGLTSITIPNSVTSIGEDAFYGCSSLNEVHITALDVWCNIDFENKYANPVYFAENLYLNNQLITEFVIPDGVSEIKNYTFCNYSGLTSITIPNSVTNIGEDAFFNCDGLTSIAIPNSVTSIGDNAFSNCSGLTSITIPNSVTSIELCAFSNCSGLTSITIPNSVTSIGDWAFSYCTDLTNITIPNSVTSIGDYTFYGCYGLTSITIPNSVTSIGYCAFSGCSDLKEVHITDLDAWKDIYFEDYYYANLLYYGAKLYLNGVEVTDY